MPFGILIENDFLPSTLTSHAQKDPENVAPEKAFFRIHARTEHVSVTLQCMWLFFSLEVHVFKFILQINTLSLTGDKSLTTGWI